MTFERIEPGRQTFRVIRSLSAGRGDLVSAIGFAEAQNWPATALFFKAAVDPVTFAGAGGARNPVALDVAEVLRPLTIVGRLAENMRRVPTNCSVLSQSVGGSGDWVAEGAPIPVDAVDLEDLATLAPRRVAGIRIMTADLVRLAAEEGEQAVARDALGGVVEALDSAFIDPSNGGSSLKPASITHGATSYSSSGTALADIDADLARLVRVLVAAECSLASARWIMAPSTATALSLKRGTGGAPAYPQVTARGGQLVGLPVVTSTHVTSSGSPGERFVALVECDQIDISDDGAAEVDLSTKAAVQADTAPSAGAAQLTSLWQLGLVGIRVQRYLNWRVRRSGAVAVLTDVVY